MKNRIQDRQAEKVFLSGIRRARLLSRELKSNDNPSEVRRLEDESRALASELYHCSVKLCIGGSRLSK